MSQRVSPDRYSRRARITRLDSLRQNTTHRMTYDTVRPARTVRIFVGDEPLIVDDLSSAAGPERVCSSLMNQTSGNHDRVSRCFTIATTNIRYCYILYRRHYLSLGCRIFVARANSAFDRREMIFYRKIFLRYTYLNVDVYTLIR